MKISTKSPGTEREVYFDLMRIAATFAVMLLHVAAQNWYGGDIYSPAWNAFNLYDGAARWCVPVFTMLSGALFLGRDRPVRTLYGKSILRIVTAFCFWSLLYALADYRHGAGLRGAAASFIRGHYHMWFLYMIVGLYLLVPLLQKIAENEFLTKYFLALGLVFAFILPQTASVLSYFYPGAAGLLWTVMDYMQFFFVGGYTFYFLLGYYLRRRALRGGTAGVVCLVCACGFPATVLLSGMLSRYAQVPSDLFYGDLTVNVLMESVFVFVLGKYLLGRLSFGERFRRIAARLAKYSFGAYLVHPFVLEGLDGAFGLNSLSFEPYAAVPVIAALVFLISFAVSELLNHIPGLDRYII